jgi:hypothetical protein
MEGSDDKEILNVPLKLSPEGEPDIDDAVFETPEFKAYANEYLKRKEKIKSAPVLGTVVASQDGTNSNFNVLDDTISTIHDPNNPFNAEVRINQFGDSVKGRGGKSRKARKAKKSKGGKSKKARKSLRRK